MLTQGVHPKVVQEKVGTFANQPDIGNLFTCLAGFAE